MTDTIIPIESIKQSARAAAERGDPPSVCPYLTGTDAEYHWKDAYYLHMHRLEAAGEVAA